MESPVLSRGPAHGVPSAQLRIPEAAFALSGASKHQTATEHHDASPANNSVRSFSIVSTRNESSRMSRGWRLDHSATRSRRIKTRSGQNGLNCAKQWGSPKVREPLRYALEVWQERQDSNLRPAVLELYSACFGLYQPVPENPSPYHGIGVAGVSPSQPVSASPRQFVTIL